MESVGTPLLWGIFSTFVLIALAIDFLVMRQQGAHKISMREAAIWSAIWVAVSFVFVGGLWWYLGGPSNPAANLKATEFITGYLIEKALAVDNIFVFLLLFTYFKVKPEHQKRGLMIGILGALALRAVMIVVGAWLIAKFHWMLYFFGAFLVYTGIKMWWATGHEIDFDKNVLLKWMRRHIRVSSSYDGEKLFTYPDGVRTATPLLLVIGLIGFIDVVFAVDSIPAIFAITTDPFIVLTSNVFAILGLRAMYFLLAGAHNTFHLLSYGLAIVLTFIGVKMLLMDIYKIPILVSLGVTVAVLAIAMALSVMIPPKHSSAGE
ncbi:MAG: TerC family protein [Candidatus Hydrogenedentes bacterium]|nr:TerC family protein [Candidatus Hydrogenedentota bacterium]